MQMPILKQDTTGQTDFYAELSDGKLNVYLYQLSSTGGYKLIGSKGNLSISYAESPVGPGYVNLSI
jgi:hypothetical protein